MSTAENVKAQLSALLNQANNTTGKADANLTAAVASLAAGFGQGGSGGGGATEPYIEEVIDDDGNLINATVHGHTIRNYAFYNCSKLASTSLPSEITSIGNYAFYKCSKLALTSLPSGLTSIGDNTFSNCSKLALTSLPSGLTSIGD